MAKKWTALGLAALPDGGPDTRPGHERERKWKKYSDPTSAGLRLQVRGDLRSWTLVFSSPTIPDKQGNRMRREIGLGKLADVGLKEARDKAEALRVLIRSGVDPMEAKKETLAANATTKAQEKVAKKVDAATLRRVARDYHEATVEPKLNPKDSARWIARIEQHVPSAILDRPIATIRAAELLDALRPVYRKLPTTGRRIKQGLDAVFDDAVLREIVAANPVKVLGRPLRDEKHVKGNWRALPYRDVPALVARLRTLPGNAARALEFAILTAARTSEVLKMEWAELAPDGTTWVVPAKRMKGREAHTVYLSAAARAVLDRVRGESEAWCFRSPERDAALSNMAMLTLLRRLEIADKTTVHGLRSSFSTWANEGAVARPDVIEAALAHQEADKVRAAYNRAEFTDERRALLEKWGAFAAPTPKRRAKAKVLPLRRAKR